MQVFHIVVEAAQPYTNALQQLEDFVLLSLLSRLKTLRINTGGAAESSPWLA